MATIKKGTAGVIKSISDLNTVVEKKSKSGTVYRGQKSAQYKLVPKIGRYESLKTLANLEKEERYMLNLFKRYSVPYLSFQPKNDFEWLALAQHHGLPTRLLDWTRNPLVAVFFAIEEDFDGDSALFLYTNSSHMVISDQKSPFALNTEVGKYVPDNFTDRIIAQNGLFTVHKDPLKEFDDSKNLEKYIIPSDYRKGLKRSLYKFGVHRASLFPDLDGLSKYIEYLRTDNH